ncbi:MAG: hypothetical protein JWM85_327, partial [Acidimicrobiaceae bacterium]|nr:hypothetical protein [Acidimicrobiaceae bacterium]
MPDTPGRQVVEYWIGDFDSSGAVIVFYTNNDSQQGIAGGSLRRGPFKVLRCRLWARRNGCGWPQR